MMYTPPVLVETIEYIIDMFPDSLPTTAHLPTYTTTGTTSPPTFSQFFSASVAESLANSVPHVGPLPSALYVERTTDSPDNTADPLADPIVSIRKIQDVFQFSVTEIARWLGVSRPTIYAWRDGKTTPDSETHRSELHALASYAKQFVDAGIERPHTILHARFFDGQSALDLMKAKKLADAQIDELARHNANRELEQQRSLASIEGRKTHNDWQLDSSLPTMDESNN